MAEEECQQQRADVGAVHIGVGHENDFPVTDLRSVEVVLTDSAAEGRNHGADFLVAEHFVVACFLDVEDLALERKYRLKLPITALLCGSPCTFALDEIEFAAFRIPFAAVGELAGQSTTVNRTFAAGQVTGLACRFARARRLNRFVDDPSSHWRVLFEKHAEAFVDKRLHGAGDIGVELALGLAFKLRLRQLHAHHRDQAFADVVAAQILFHVFKKAHLLADIVDGAREGCAGNRKMGAIDGIDVVREAEDGFGVAVVVLEGNIYFNVVARSLHDDRLVVEHGFAAVQMLDELRDAANIAELGATGFSGFGIGGALVGERDFEALVEEGHLAKALGSIVVKLGNGEDGFVSQEVYLGAAALLVPVFNSFEVGVPLA